MNLGHPVQEQVSRSAPPSLSNFNNMVRIINALRSMIFDPTYFEVTSNGVSPPTISIRKGVSSIPEEFGIKSQFGNKITIYSGTLYLAEIPVVAVETELTVTTETAYLGWDYSHAAKTLTITNFGSTFVLDPAHIRKWLYKAEKTVHPNGGFSLRIIRLGHLNPVFPSNFGEEA